MTAKWLGFGTALLLASWDGTAHASTSLTNPPPDAQMGDGLALQFDLTAGVDPQAAVVCPAGPTLAGIDVSRWQTDVDWAAVAGDGISFAFVRVSDGLNTIDQYYEDNWADSRANGLTVGTYQFFRPAQDPVAQADLLLDRMGPLQPGDLPPVIDVEADGGLAPAQVAASVRAWIERVESVTGVQPIIYSGRFFWQDNVGTDEFNGYPLWIAHYTNGCPNIPLQWQNWAFHQYTASGSVAGVMGDCDRNDFNGDLAALTEFAGGQSVCGDEICNGGEDADSCPEDCPVCGVVPELGGVIDNGEECYELYGNNDFWRDESSGFGGSLVWTLTTDLATAANYAIWRLHFAEAGEYRVEAHLDPAFAQSRQASYHVEHATGVDTVVVDQSAASDWEEIGEFRFEAGGGQSIRLDDNTGEPNADQLQLVYDALRITRLDPPAGGETGGADGGEGGDSGNDSRGDGAETGDGPGLDPGMGGQSDGCGCVADRRPAGGMWLLLTVLAGIRTRVRGGRR